MKPTLNSRSFAVLLLVLFAASHAVAKDLREWTDKTGKHKIDAEFVAVEGKNVQLRKRDNSTVTLPIAKLSKADQKYLRDLMKARKREQAANEFADPDPLSLDGPAEAVEQMQRDFAAMDEIDKEVDELIRQQKSKLAPRDRSMRFKVGDKVEYRDFGVWKPGKITAIDPVWNQYKITLAEDNRQVESLDMKLRVRALTGAATTPPADDLKAAETDFQRIRQVSLAGSAKGTFQPDPAANGVPDWQPQRVDLPAHEGGLDILTAVTLAGPSARAVVVHELKGGREDDQTRLDVCDLETGRVISQLRGPASVALAALSPDGRRLVTVSKAGSFRHGPVQLWDLGGKELKPVSSWNALANPDNREFKWIGWADDGRVMTVDDSGLIVWSVDGPRAEYQVTGEHIHVPALSPGGRQLAVGYANGAAVIELATGKLLAHLPISEYEFERRVAFSPSGKQLAAADASNASIYDIATGEKTLATKFISGKAGPGGESFFWLDEEHLLADGSSVIHVPSKMGVWKYRHDAAAVAPLAGRVWYAFAGRGRTPASLVPLQLPHAAVKPVAPSELALQPGDEVSIQMELSAAPTQGMGGKMTPPEEQLKQALKQAGYVVADSSNKQIVARATPGPSREIRYRMPGGQDGTVSVTPRVYELELIVDGQSVWKRQTVHDAPTMILLEENETIEQATERAMQTDIGFFNSAIPARVLTAAATDARTSELSAAGIE